MENKKVGINLREAVQQIKAAVLRSQARSVQYINQEQLSLYFGIGRYVSEHSRNGYWGTGAIDNISKQLKSELPGLRGFSSENIKLMRRFYETWKDIEPNSVVGTTEIADDALKSLPSNLVVETTELQSPDNKEDIIQGLRLTKDERFPIVAFLNISFTHHVAIMRYAKEYDERKYYIQLAYQQRLKADDLESMIKANVYSHRDALPNNFFKTIPDKALALRTIQMFKDEYLLDYINVEEIDVSDPMDIDEKVIETKIVMNIKNFIMTFGRSFTYKGHQVHYDKMGHDHWIDLLFFNRELRSLVVVELKKGQFKPSYLGQLAAYLRILDDDERLKEENPSVGIILCKKADKAYVDYVLQDYRKPMGVATYQQMQNRLRELLPPEEEMKRILEGENETLDTEKEDGDE
jgi:predicted nuclease of restriction endonuclease-like (RecB) superfamily